MASVNKFGATVQWEPPKSDGGSDITAYVIELRDRTSVKWEAALVCGGNERSAALNDVVENKEYIFRVRAENKAGIGRPSNATSPVKIMDPIGGYRPHQSLTGSGLSQPPPQRSCSDLFVSLSLQRDRVLLRT